MTSRSWYLRLLACLPLVLGMGPNSCLFWGPWMYFFNELHQGIHILSTALLLLGSDRALHECIILYIYGASAWPLCREDWLLSLALTLSTSTFIFSLIEEISERTIKYGLLFGVYFTAFGAHALLSPFYPSP